MLLRTTLFLVKKHRVLVTVIRTLYRIRLSIHGMDMLSSHAAMTVFTRSSVNCSNARTWRQTPDLLRIHSEFGTASNLCLIRRNSSGKAGTSCSRFRAGCRFVANLGSVARTWRQTPDLLRIHSEFGTASNLCLLCRRNSCGARQRNGYQSCAL